MKSAVLLLASLVGALQVEFIPVQPACDNSTFGNVEQIATEHFHVDWEVSFSEELVKGSVFHDLVVVSKEVTFVQFDVKDISVSGVWQVTPGSALATGKRQIPRVPKIAPLQYQILTPNPNVGSVLVVALEKALTFGDIVSIEIEYETHGTTSLSWMKKE